MSFNKNELQYGKETTMPYTVKKIDVHVHTRDFGGIEMPRRDGSTYAGPQRIREMYDDWGIEFGILLGEVSTYAATCPISNENLCLIARKYPETFKWFMDLDPHMGNNDTTTDFTAIIEHYRALGALGVGEVTASLPFDNPLLMNMLRHCNDCAVPLTFHLAPAAIGHYGYVDSHGLPGLEGALKAYPNIKFLGHSMMFWSHISGDVTPENMNIYPSGKVTPGGRLGELLDEYPNLYCDMSAGSGGNAFLRDHEHAWRFIEKYPDRLLFGTDICAPHNFFPLSGWLDESLMKGCISQENYNLICRGNAERIILNAR